MATASRRTARSTNNNGAGRNTKTKTRTSTKVTPEKLAHTLIAALTFPAKSEIQMRRA